MTERRDPEPPADPPAHEPVDESSYAASSSESGGLYSADGPTTANPEGDTMGTAEEDLADEEVTPED